MRKFVYAIVVLILAVGLLIPSVAFADQQQVDNDIALSGNQNIVDLTAAPGATVDTSAQIVIQRSGNNHLTAGTAVTFVDADGGQTTLPSGYSVANLQLTVPDPWNTNGQEVAGWSAISFTAPATPGSYSYTVKWTTTVDYGNKLTGGPALAINLTVSSALPMESDITPPTTTITLDPASPNGNNGWYVTDVHVTVSATDNGGSGVNETRSVLDPATPPATFEDIPQANPYDGGGANVTADGQHIVYAASIDNDGNEETPVNATFKIDQTPPEVNITGPSAVLQYAFATATVTASDATSGLYEDPSGSLTLDTSTVGTHTVTVWAEDNAGNRGSASLTYTVWGVIGPFPPLVKNGQGVGQFKAGSTIPVKFQLTDGTNLISTAQGSVAIGSSTAPFRWDATALQYIANVKTDKTPATGVSVVLSVTGVAGTANLATIDLR
jgi:hypothetical protein